MVREERKEIVMSAQIVFALYKPNESKDAELRALIARHIPALRKLGLITPRASVLARASDGTYIEIFEWVSNEASRKAHEHPEIAEIWEQMGVVGTFRKLNQLAEAAHEFSHFAPVSL
jgi:hypothetical protein